MKPLCQKRLLFFWKMLMVRLRNIYFVLDQMDEGRGKGVSELMLVMFKQKHAKLRGMISGFVLMCVGFWVLCFVFFFYYYS